MGFGHRIYAGTVMCRLNVSLLSEVGPRYLKWVTYSILEVLLGAFTPVLFNSVKSNSGTFSPGTACVGRCEHSKGTWVQNNWNGSKQSGLFYKFELK